MSEEDDHRALARKVAAGEEVWDCLRLDWGRRGIAFLGKRPPNRIDERKVLKFDHVF